jgi:hypothetical protein
LVTTKFAMQRRRPLADLGLDRGLVDGQHLAAFGDDAARHHGHGDGAAIGAIDKLLANVIQRCKRQMIEIDQDQIGLLADLE